MKHFTCGRFLVVSSLCTLLLAFAHSALAETYYWNKTDDNGGSYYKWSDAANWLVGDSKTAATQAPGEGDVIKRDNTQAIEKMYVDLEDKDVTIGAIYFAEGAWAGDKIFLKNGTLTLSAGETSFFTPTAISLQDATLKFNSDVLLGWKNYSDSSHWSLMQNTRLPRLDLRLTRVAPCASALMPSRKMRTRARRFRLSITVARLTCRTGM